MTMLKVVGLMIGLWIGVAATAQEQYVAADGAYTISIPPGWQLTEQATHLQISKNKVDITVLTIPTQAVDMAISAALARLEITPGTLLSSADAPLPNGVWEQHIYAADQILTVALAQARDRLAHILVIVGEQAAVQAANPELLQLLTSITFDETPPQPAYVDASSFAERAVNFGEAPYILSGVLSLPQGEGPFPAVVIVHGSGPHNRDGLLGPLTPYRDIAQGLSSRGIAVLRYDKRTFTYGASITIDAAFTIDSESTEDAAHAVAFLRQRADIDSKRVFVLGHSQGAMLTPRILARAEAAAGGILLAAPARPFSALVDEQLAYIADVNPSALASPSMAYMQDLADRFQQVAAGASYDDVFGESAAYHQSLESIDAIAEAREIAHPLLILQGERDYQVTMQDLARWQDAFAADERVTFHAYPELNHMFMASGDLSRLSIPQDYALPAFVAARVIADIATWVDAVD
ncbi:MAG: alpha/beta fold hydrolase [Chloroflexi bacterium]|nr:alpha/beta fold hydrolase [Chloroflexota bacterium]MCY4247084.1 alpha/beta fold hydrolase [Chloroflexota bacterium]